MVSLADESRREGTPLADPARRRSVDFLDSRDDLMLEVAHMNDSWLAEEPRICFDKLDGEYTRPLQNAQDSILIFISL
jgi:hypothetical protein